LAYAEREVLTAAIAATDGAVASIAGVLQLLVSLYALKRIQSDMAFFLTEVKSVKAVQVVLY